MRASAIALLRGIVVAVAVGAVCLLASLMLIRPPADPVLLTCFYLVPFIAGGVVSGAWYRAVAPREYCPSTRRLR